MNPCRIAAGAVLLLTVLFETPVAAARTDKADPEQVRQQYEQVMSHLDPGGDLLLVANFDGLLEEFVDTLTQFTELAGSADPGAEVLRETVRKVPGFLQGQGLYAIKGYGLSMVPRPDGLFEMKSYLSRESSAAGLPLWRAMVGDRARRLEGLAYLPADTVLVRLSMTELEQLWVMVRNGVHEFATPETARSFDEAIASLTPMLGADFESLMQSLGDEVFFSIQMSTEQTVQLPTPAGVLTIPSPSLLFGIAVDGEELAAMVESQLAKGDVPVTTTMVDGATVNTLAMPIPFPIPVQPSLVRHGNFILIGSTLNVVMNAIAARQNGNGLVAAREFKTAFEELPMENNGLIYVHPRMTDALTELQVGLTSMSPGPQQQLLAPVVRKMADMRGPQSAALVVVNGRDGVLTQGTTSSSGREMVTGLMMAPMGAMAAVAIPSFVKARETSQKNACINNLRQLDAAKEQWALQYRKTNGDAINEEGVLQYVKGARMPVCPKGGVYTLGPIGTDPTCSIPDHRLP